MIRITILLSLATVIVGYPKNLEWLFGVNKNTTSKEERSICTTDECKTIAEVIKGCMNDSVDPCEDFYEYACGNWAKYNPIPENKSSWSLWEMTQENIENKIKELMTVKEKPDDILAVRLAKKWFHSCTDIERLERVGLDPLLATLSRHGGWPLIMEPDEWDNMLYTWQKVDDYYAQLTGYNAFFHVDVFQLDWDVLITAIDTPSLPPKSYYLMSGVEDDEDEEEEETGEHSQEGGSEERNENNENDEEDEDETEDETDNDEEEEKDEEERKTRLKVKKVLKKKHNKGLSHAKKKSNKVQKISKKHHAGQKMKKRVKRKTTKRRLHNNKQQKEQHIKKHKIIHHRIKDKVKASRVHKKVSVATHVKASMKKNTVEDGSEDENDKTNESDDGNDNDNTSKDNESDGNDTDEDEDTENYETDDSTVESNGDYDYNGDDDNNESDNNEDTDDSEDSEDTDDSDDSDDSDDDSEEVDAAVFREKYAEYIKKVALALAKARGIQISEKKLIKDIEDMLAFQVELAQITRSKWSMENVTLSEFQEIYDSFKPTTHTGKVNWMDKIKMLFAEAGKKVDDNMNVTLIYGKYMKKLRVLLDTTSPTTIVNYVHWNFISRLVRATTEEMRNLYYDLFEDEDLKTMSRSEICTQEVKISDMVAYDYVHKYFSDDTMKMGMDMIDDIQKEVEYQVKESEWLDDETKDFVLDKLVNMEKLVGYPDWYRNSTALKQFYKGLVIGPSFYENTLSELRRSRWKSLATSINEDDDLWFMSPLVLNAYFLPTKNSITITAADFESPFFAYNRPQGINFGIIGFIMAHEVNHGFDDEGHLYSKTGKFSEWLSTMAEAYNKRAGCFVDQFNNYSILKSKNYKIKNYGNMTAGENIADTMGLQAVYRAYRRRQRECKAVEPALPGLENFTNDQIFFLSFANLWCEVVDPKTAKRHAKYDVHSPGRLRTIGSVSNSEDFARAYNCPVGSPMNPEKKCNIWK